MSSSEYSMSSDNKDALLSQFQEICAVDEVSTASLYLQRFQWNLEEAIQHYLAEKDGEVGSSVASNRSNSDDIPQEEIPSMAARDHHTNSSRPVRMSSSTLTETRRRASHAPRQPAVSWSEWAWSLVTLPLKFVFITVYDVWRFVYRSFFNFDRAIANPAEDVDKFFQDYESKYGAEHPTFYRGSYSQALTDARKELKYLCVYLHCDTHRDTDKFCRSTLNNRQVRELLNTQTLFWACSIKQREGYRVSQAMHEATYPFVAMISIRESRMMIVARQEGYLDASAFSTFLNTTMTDNAVYMNLARQERLNQRENQMLREQQEQAFQESLQRDREKQRLKDEQAKRERERLEKEKRETELLQEIRQNLVKRKNEVRTSLSPEPSTIAADENPADVVRVSVKFPNGARFERRFYTSDPLKGLFDFTMCQEDCPESFSVFNVFPRQILLSANLLEQNLNEICPDYHFDSFKDAGLHRSATLIVQDNNA